MRRLYIWAFILTTNSFAQTTDTKEQFFNSVYKIFVDSSFSTFYLSNELSRLYIDKYNQEQVRIDFGKFIPDSLLKQIIWKSSRDTITQKWQCNNLTEKARCISSDSISKITGESTTYTIIIKEKWTERKKEKEKEKQINKQQKERVIKPMKDRILYFFSRPIFSDDQRFVIIAIGYGCGSLCGHGCTYLFEKVNGKWKKIAETSCWVS
jgi:hypothetical protein